MTETEAQENKSATLEDFLNGVEVGDMLHVSLVTGYVGISDRERGIVHIVKKEIEKVAIPQEIKTLLGEVRNKWASEFSENQHLWEHGHYEVKAICSTKPKCIRMCTTDGLTVFIDYEWIAKARVYKAGEKFKRE